MARSLWYICITMNFMKTNYKAEGEKAAEKHKQIQEQIAKADKQRPKEEPKKAMQAGAREYPEPPVAKQHLDKPGIEEELDFEPMYDAPYYKGSDKLKD